MNAIYIPIDSIIKEIFINYIYILSLLHPTQKKQKVYRKIYSKNKIVSKNGMLYVVCINAYDQGVAQQVPNHMLRSHSTVPSDEIRGIEIGSADSVAIEQGMDRNQPRIKIPNTVGRAKRWLRDFDVISHSRTVTQNRIINTFPL